MLPCGGPRCWRDFAPVPSPCGRPLELAGRLPESRYRKRSLSQGQRRHPLRERGRWRGYRRRAGFRTPVRIWGSDLLSAAVEFNGITAAVVSNSGPNYVWATVPSGATTGPITITTPGGTYTTHASFAVE